MSLDVDYQDPIYGKTALMRAAALGNYELVEALINHGADVDVKDIVTHRTALEMAISARNKDNLLGYGNTIKLLRQKTRKHKQEDSQAQEEELKRQQEDIKRFHQEELKRKEEQRLEEERLASQRAQEALDRARALADLVKESWNEDVAAEEVEEEGWRELNQD